MYCITVIGELNGQLVVKQYDFLDVGHPKVEASKLAAQEGIVVKLILDNTERQHMTNQLVNVGDVELQTVLGDSGQAVTIRIKDEQTNISFAGYCDYYSSHGNGRQIEVKAMQDDVKVSVFSDANICRATHDCLLDGARSLPTRFIVKPSAVT